MRFKLAIFSLVALALLGVSVVSHAQGPDQGKPVIKLTLGANWAVFDGAPIANDVEGVLHASASLQPHLGVVGDFDYGFRNGYRRWSAGPRITVSDPEREDFSIGLGIQYEGSAGKYFGEPEWAPTAAIGFKPWKDSKTLKKVTVGALSAYGLTSKATRLELGARYSFKL